MFRASLCPSSGALDRVILCTRSVSWLPKTPASTLSAENHIRSSAPEDGHKDARNMLS